MDTNVNEKKENNSLIKVILILAVLVVFFGIGFVIAKHFIPVEETDIEIEEVVTTYDEDDSMIQTLLSQLTVGEDCWIIEEYANDHKVSVKDLSNTRIYEVTSINSFYSKGVESVDIEDFDTEIQKYFAIGYSFEPEKTNDSVGCNPYSYDSETQKFIGSKLACGSTCGPNRSQYKVMGATEKDLILTVSVRVLFGSQAEQIAFYSDYERTNYITDDYEHLDDYYKEGDEYLFTFEKVEDHYVFVSSEKA